MANPKLRTRHNYDAFEVVSALQKCIRRGLEEDALYWAYELAESPNKNHYSWLWARLKVSACEDVGPANPIMPLLIDVLWRNWKEKKAQRLWYTNAVFALVRSPKSRIVDNALNMQLSEDELGWRSPSHLKLQFGRLLPLKTEEERPSGIFVASVLRRFIRLPSECWLKHFSLDRI
jgi:replication-associated recombination protein RarA